MGRFPKKKRRLPLWLRRTRDAIYQIVFPLICFQLLRTILFPSAFDVILLAFMIFIYLCFVFDIF